MVGKGGAVMASKTGRKVWVLDLDGNEIELEDGEPIPDGCSVHVRFLDSSGRTDGYICDGRGRAYLDYCDRLSSAHRAKDTAHSVRDGRPNPWRWYLDWHAARVSA